MNGNIQGRNEIVVAVGPEVIWTILQDSTRLTQWAPMVEHTTGAREAVGAVRECRVQLDGRPGRVTERCVVFEPHSRIGWELMEDTFGFSRMLRDFGFDFVLEPVGGNATRVQSTTYYNPNGLFGAVMNILAMRGKFHHIRALMLANLKALSEREGAGEAVVPRSGPGPHAG